MGGVETGPAGAGIEVLVDEAIPEPGQCHPLRTPLAESHAMSPAVTAEANRTGRRRRRTGGGIGRALSTKRGLGRFGLISIESPLQPATQAIQAGEPDQGLAPKAVELTVVAGDGGDLPGDRVGPRLQRLEQWSQVRLRLGQHAALRLEGVALDTQPPSQLQLAYRDLLQVDGAIQQVVEAAGREHELHPAHAAQGIELADVGLKGSKVLLVGQPRVREL